MDRMTDKSTHGGPMFSMVVGFAFTDADGPAFDHAARVAQRVGRCQLHIVHVFPGDLTIEQSRDLVGRLRVHVNEKAAIANGLRGMTVGIHLRAGKAVREIVQLATEVHAELIVLGADRAPRLKHWVLGSTAEKLIGCAPCPVLVAAPRPRMVEAQEPAIEPACPRCVQTRIASGGARWWCACHFDVEAGAHTYSYQREIPLASPGASVLSTSVGH
jgi:nucleotide-binding universal stress UspA family protein